MINKNISKLAISAVSIAGLFSCFVLNASAQTTTPKIFANLAKAISKADSAIEKRIEALNKLSTRVGQMKNISSSEISDISKKIQTEISSLNTLKAKIDADTDIKTVAADAKTVVSGYRIYALVVPQASMIASADRIATIVTMIKSTQDKLQARVNADKSAGKNVDSIQTMLNDMTAKLTDALTQAQRAQNLVALLVPDNGDDKVASSNKTALLSARENIKTATEDIKSARKDVEAIAKGLKSMNTKNASSTAQ